MKKNVAGQHIGAQMVSASDGSAFTGSVTVYVTGNAGTQAAGSVGSGACTHEGNGYHTYAPAQAETNYDLIAFTFVGSGAIPATVQVFTTFPQTGDNYARLGAPAGVSVSADIAAVAGYVDTEVGAIKAKTDNLPASPAATSDIPTAVAIADQVWDEILSGHAVSGSTGQALSAAGAAGDPWITALPGSYSAGQAGYIIGTNLDAAVSAVKTKTDNLPSDPADESLVIAATNAIAALIGTPAGASLSADVAAVPTATENADALLNRDMSAVSDTISRSPLNALRMLRNKWANSGGTLSVKKEDDTTEAWSAALSTDAAADPITGIDPA